MFVCKHICCNTFKKEIYWQIDFFHIMYIYLNPCKQMTDVKLLVLHINTWNHLTVCKQKMNSK